MKKLSRILIIGIVVALFKAGCATNQPIQYPDSFVEQVDALVANYIELKNELVNDNPGLTAKEAAEFQTYLREVNGSSLKGEAGELWIATKLELLDLLEQQANTINIQSQRQIFAALSEKMDTLVNKFGPGRKILYKQYCPKAFDGEGAYWLNEKEEILNPYGGKDQLRCGKVIEIFIGKKEQLDSNPPS